MSAPDRTATSDSSRWPAIARGALPLLLLALAGAVLLVVAELSTLFEVEAVTVEIDDVRGIDQHDSALILIAVAAALLAVLGHLRPPLATMASAGLLVLGALVVGIAAFGDLPDVDDTGLVRDSQNRYENADSSAGPGLYIEAVGGVLLLLAGGLGLLRAWFTRAPAAPVPAKDPFDEDEPADDWSVTF